MGLFNVTLLRLKALIVNESITDQQFNILCWESWIKPNEYVALNKTPRYNYIHQSHLDGKGGGVAVIYNEPEHKFNAFKILYANI